MTRGSNDAYKNKGRKKGLLWLSFLTDDLCFRSIGGGIGVELASLLQHGGSLVGRRKAYVPSLPHSIGVTVL